MAALKVTLGFFVWLFRAVFKWVMLEEAGICPPLPRSALPPLVPVVVAGCAACVGREREEPHEEPYSEGRESHPSTSFA